jgi:hypothetical protein
MKFKDQLDYIAIMALSILLAFSIGQLFFSKRKLKNIIKYQEIEFHELSVKYDLTINSIKNGYKIENKLLNEVLLFDSDDDTLKLSSLTSEAPLFIVRFSEHNCNPCIDTLITFIKRGLLENYADNIIFLVSFENKRRLTIFKEKYQISSNILLTNPYELYLDRNGIPYIFKLDSSLIPQSIFFFDANNPGLTTDYIDFIEEDILDNMVKK